MQWTCCHLFINQDQDVLLSECTLLIFQAPTNYSPLCYSFILVSYLKWVAFLLGLALSLIYTWELTNSLLVPYVQQHWETAQRLINSHMPGCFHTLFGDPSVWHLFSFSQMSYFDLKRFIYFQVKCNSNKVLMSEKELGPFDVKQEISLCYFWKKNQGSQMSLHSWRQLCDFIQSTFIWLNVFVTF